MKAFVMRESSYWADTLLLKKETGVAARTGCKINIDANDQDLRLTSLGHTLS